MNIAPIAASIATMMADEHLAFARTIGSIFQITFLHGFWLLYFFDRKKWIRRSTLQTLIFSFALSLLINYAVFFGLTSLLLSFQPKDVLFPTEIQHIMLLPPDWVDARNYVLYAIFGVEFFGFATVIFLPTQRGGITAVDARAATLALVLPLTFFLVAQLGNEPISSLYVSDELGAYRSWTEAWFRGQLPFGINQYGQVVTTAWAAINIAYGKLGIAFFAKSIMPLFSLYIILVLMELGRQTRKPVFWASAFVTWGLLALTLWQRSAILAGKADSVLRYLFSFVSMNTDAPAAFFGFLVFACLLFAHHACGKGNRSKQAAYVTLSVAIAIAAGSTKQAGMWMVAAYPFALYFLDLYRNQGLVKKIGYPLAYFCIILAGVFPLYLYNELSIRWGINDRTFLASISGRMNSMGPTPISHITPAYQLIVPYFYSKYIPPLLGLLAFIGCCTGEAWVLISAVIAVSYLFVWMMFVSYEIPNLTLSLPFFGLAMGNGFVYLARRIPYSKLYEKGPPMKDRIKNFGRIVIPTSIFYERVAFFCLVFVIFGSSVALPEPWLAARQAYFKEKYKDQIFDDSVPAYFALVGRKG